MKSHISTENLKSQDLSIIMQVNEVVDIHCLKSEMNTHYQ